MIGRITKELELKALPSGMKVVSFSMATNRTWKDKEGAKKEETDFHNLTAFGKTAEVLTQYVKKGQLLYAEGRMQTRSWEDKTSKKKMYKTDIIVENFQFGPKAQGTGETKKVDEVQIDEPETPVEEINPEDIPF